MEHALGHVEVGDDAVLEGTHGDDVRGGTSDHALRLGADCQHLLRNAVDCDDTGLIYDNAAAFDHDQRVRRPEVYANVMRK